MLGVSIQDFTQLCGRADFFRRFIWSRVYGLMRFRDVFDNMSRTRVFEWEVQTHPDRKVRDR
jgi:hypothetical protein